MNSMQLQLEHCKYGSNLPSVQIPVTVLVAKKALIPLEVVMSSLGDQWQLEHA